MTIGRLAIDDEVAARFPDYAAIVFYARGLGPSTATTARALNEAARDATRELQGAAASEHPHVAAWRRAFRSFGAKPSRYPSSVEALLKRIAKGAPPPRINRLVDAYNAVSLRHVLPAGGEDLDRLVGHGRLRIADAGCGGTAASSSGRRVHRRPARAVPGRRARGRAHRSGLDRLARATASRRAKRDAAADARCSSTAIFSGWARGLAGRVIETAFRAELSEHLGYPPAQTPPDGAGNHHNGHTPKMVQTELGSFPWFVERERRSLRPRPLRLGPFGVIRQDRRRNRRCRRPYPVAQVATTGHELKSGLPARVQEALGELAGAAIEGLMALSVGVGLGVRGELRERESTRPWARTAATTATASRSVMAMRPVS